MNFKIADNAKELEEDLTSFEAIGGTKRIHKRTRVLKSQFESSFFNAKVTLDYHWLELCLFDLIRRNYNFDQLYLDDKCAVKFLSMCARVYRRLSLKGKKALKGRIIDSLKSDYGFAPLYLEMDIALRMMYHGFDVDFTDLENSHRFDLLVRHGNFELEIECKSQSVDAGRKIHRKDFYRFATLVKPILDQIIEFKYQAIIVTLNNRLPTKLEDQDEIKTAIFDLCKNGQKKYQSNICDIEIEDLSLQLHDMDNWEDKCKERYGNDIHMTGAMGETGAGFLILKSAREDDTSKPLLNAQKKAYSQFSGTRPTLICLQYNEMTPMNLAQDNVRRRDGILANYMFHCGKYNNLGGISVGCYKNAVSDLIAIETPPAYAILNPQPTNTIPEIFFDALGRGNTFGDFLEAVTQDVAQEI